MRRTVAISGKNLQATAEIGIVLDRRERVYPHKSWAGHACRSIVRSKVIKMIRIRFWVWVDTVGVMLALSMTGCGSSQTAGTTTPVNNSSTVATTGTNPANAAAPGMAHGAATGPAGKMGGPPAGMAMAPGLNPGMAAPPGANPGMATPPGANAPQGAGSPPPGAHMAGGPGMAAAPNGPAGKPGMAMDPAMMGMGKDPAAMAKAGGAGM